MLSISVCYVCDSMLGVSLSKSKPFRALIDRKNKVLSKLFVRFILRKV